MRQRGTEKGMHTFPETTTEIKPLAIYADTIITLSLVANVRNVRKCLGVYALT